ncbi:MAG: rod shape-determining protein MreC [Thermoanaerobacterales bacterium]|jgi:rod shape-determining protein MreC|nr:rod shape-determining protein MreC [Thermoanaerobacterales bacterium]
MAVSPSSGSRTRILVLLLASVTLVVLGLRDVPVVRDLREGAAAALEPVEGALDTVTSPVRNAWHGITDYDDVKRENERLRTQLAEAEAAEIARTDAETQLAELSESLDLPFAGDVPTVTARVVAGPRSNFSHALEIDKGADAGLAEGMPVVTGGGLVGRIDQVTAGTARVELVTDPDFRVGVRLATTGALGTAHGQGSEEPLRVDSSLPPRTEVEQGTGVVTSGVDRSAFPPGVPVGTVVETQQGAGGLTLELVVEPLVEVSQLSYVTVLLWQPG